MSKITQGAGNQVLGGKTLRVRDFVTQFDIGQSGVAFPVPSFLGANVAEAVPDLDWAFDQRAMLAQAPTVNPFDPRSPKGSVVHLDQRQIYATDSHSAFLETRIDRLLLEMVDANGPLTPSECPLLGAPFKVLGVVPSSPCASLRTVVHYRIRAWAVAGGARLLDLGGSVFVEGIGGDWNVGVATDSGSHGAFWEGATIIRNPDVGGNGEPPLHDGPHVQVFTTRDAPITLKVPLRSLKARPGFHPLFGVQLTMDATAIDERGGESGAQALIVDDDPRGSTLSAREATAHRAQSIKPPPFPPPPPARCPAGPRPDAGMVQLSAPAFSVGEAMGTPLVLVTRKGGSRGATSVTLSTSGGTARSGVDFTPTRTLVRFENGDTSQRLVEIPIREDLKAESPESFKVSLAHVRCAKLGKQRSATVTILDDDQPPPPPPAAFTVGGTVDGLQGSGLVLTDLGTAVPVSANGSFTFPETDSAGQPYRVNVSTQPHNPDQVCTVENGVGEVSNANVTNIAVHCQTTVIPPGLDTTFGDDGHVTTPGDGDGRAVLIQPDGHIVVVGRREVGILGDLQFGAAGYDAAGNLDPGFGTNGIATTSLGGSAQEANDAAMFPDGGFVTVGQADPAGLANIDFGLVRYTPDGHPDPTFGTGGVVTSDLTGHDDAANAVVVQPDGKIVAAGQATGPGNFASDFALARYNPDGALDPSFGRGGIVTTDLGTFDNSISDIALQPDGKIVAVGMTDGGAALARYLPDGSLDPSFGNAGTVIGGFGLDQFNGIAVTPDGTILLAGTDPGPNGGSETILASYGPTGKLNLDFGTLGIAHAVLSASSGADDLVVKPNGDIILVGSVDNATGDMALARFKPDGTLDTTLIADISGFGDFGHALAIDAQGRIVAAGTAGGQFGLLRANL